MEWEQADKTLATREEEIYYLQTAALRGQRAHSLSFCLQINKYRTTIWLLSTYNILALIGEPPITTVGAQIYAFSVKYSMEVLEDTEAQQ